MAIADALIERKVVKQTERMLVVHETWDTEHPDCPFVILKMVQDTAPKAQPHHVEEYWLTPEEYHQRWCKRIK